MNIFDKFFKSFIPSVYVNLKYLPFRKAVKLPIAVYNVNFLSVSGEIEIDDSVGLKRGMIRIGFPETGLHRGQRFIWEHRGKILFHGPFHFGQGGVLSTGSKGFLEVGSHVILSDATKIICFHYIGFGNETTVGWECSFCDTDFHAMKNAFTEKKLRAYAPIKIGEANWFGENCTILKGTVTPAHTTVSACSMLNKKYKCEEKSIIMGNPAEVVSEGCFYRDMKDDRFEYECYVQ